MPKPFTFISTVIFFGDYCAGDEYLSHYKFCTNSLKALLILESVRPGEMDGLCLSQVADSHLTFLLIPHCHSRHQVSRNIQRRGAIKPNTHLNMDINYQTNFALLVCQNIWKFNLKRSLPSPHSFRFKTDIHVHP